MLADDSLYQPVLLLLLVFPTLLCRLLAPEVDGICCCSHSAAATVPDASFALLLKLLRYSRADVCSSSICVCCV